MAIRTQSDLIIQILKDLGAVPDGLTPQPENIATVEVNLPSILAEMAALEFVYVPDPNSVPDEWFLSLSAYCAYELRKSFGVTGEEADQLKLGRDDAIKKLKAITRGRPTREPLRTEYF
jgi:hypothetical protein